MEKYLLVKIYVIATNGHVTLDILIKYVGRQSKRAINDENANLSD